MKASPWTRQARSGVSLLWIPLGAGGTGFVRFNGRAFEGLAALRDRRRPLDLYHTALIVGLSDSTVVVETTWPSPAGPAASRGVVVVGPVFGRRMGWTRLLRYEVRCWENGTIPDESAAVGGPQRVSDSPLVAGRLVALTREVPRLTWGRDESGAGDMWNSNSVVSWLLCRSGHDIDRIGPPTGGRAPGWEAGIAVARGPG